MPESPDNQRTHPQTQHSSRYAQPTQLQAGAVHSQHQQLVPIAQAQQPAVAPQTNNPVYNITSLAYAIDNFYRDVVARFQRLEALQQQSEARLRQSLSAPSASPPTTGQTTPGLNPAAFMASFSILEARISRIERDSGDSRDERCADMLTIRQGVDNINRTMNSLATRLSRIEGSVMELGAKAEESRAQTERLRTIECLLTGLLEKANDPEANSKFLAQHMHFNPLTCQNPSIEMPKVYHDVATATDESSWLTDLSRSRTSFVLRRLILSVH